MSADSRRGEPRGREQAGLSIGAGVIAHPPMQAGAIESDRFGALFRLHPQESGRLIFESPRPNDFEGNIEIWPHPP